jgi:hypothetical protein
LFVSTEEGEREGERPEHCPVKELERLSYIIESRWSTCEEEKGRYTDKKENKIILI